MEGGSLIQSLWFLKGNPFYVAPSLSFIPFLYTPFMTVVSGLFLAVFGVGFWPARLVSVLATLGSATLIYLFVKRETETASAAYIAAGLFLGSYGVTGFYFDVIRVDNLLMFLGGLGFFFAYLPNTKRHVLLAAFFLSLSFFTKQTGMFYLAGVGFYYLVTDRESCKLFSGSAALFLLIPFAYLQYTSDGWFTFYAFKIIATYQFYPSFVTRLFIPDLVNRIPVLTLVTFTALFYLLRCKKQRKKLRSFFPLATLTTFIASFLMRNKAGGVENCLIPLIFFEVIIVGLVLGSSYIAERKLLRITLLLLLVFQFFVYKFNPVYAIPRKADLQTGKKVLAYLQKQDESVWVLGHSYYEAMAGRWPKPQDQAISDVWRTDGPVTPDIKKMLEEHRFSQIILSSTTHTDRFHSAIYKHYYHAGMLLPPDDLSFYTKTGYAVRPQYIFLPRTGKGTMKDPDNPDNIALMVREQH